MALIADLLLKVPALTGTGKAMSPVIITKSGFSRVTIAATAFNALLSLSLLINPPPR